MSIPVQVTSNSVSVAATTNVKAFAVNVTAGNLLFVVVGNKSDTNFPSSVADSQGNSYTFWDLQQGTSIGCGTTWFAVANATGACTVTVTWSGNEISDVIIAEYPASGGTPAEDKSTTNAATAGTSLGTGSVITTVANELIITWAYDATRDGSPWSDTAGGTREATTSNAGGASLTLFDRGVSSTGTYSDTMSGGSAVSGDQLITGIITFTHIALAPPALALQCGSPPNAYVKSSYSHTFAATGGTSPYTYAITAGALPPGLTLNAATGVVSGTPTAAGTYNFTVQATDHVAATASVACSIGVTAASPAPFLVLTQSPVARLQAVFDNTKAIDNLQLLNIGGILYYFSKQSYPFLTANQQMTAYFSDATGLTWKTGAAVNVGTNSPLSSNSDGFALAQISTKVYVCDSQKPVVNLNVTMGIWVYDTATNTWTGPSNPGPLYDNSSTGAVAMVALNNSKLLIVYNQLRDAGLTNTTLKSVIYDPGAGTWGIPTVVADYGTLAGAREAQNIAILHDSITDNTVLYLVPGNTANADVLTLNAMVLSNTGALLNLSGAIYTSPSAPFINGQMGVPAITTDSHSGGRSAAFPFRSKNSNPQGDIVVAFCDFATFATALETAAIQADFESPNVISEYTQQDQGAWVALDFNGFLYLVFAVDNGILNNASSQNWLYAKSRGHSTTWSGLQLLFTSPVSRESLQPFAATWTSNGPALLENNWDPTNNPQSGTVAGLSSFILLPGSTSPTKFEISLFGSKRYNKLDEPECTEAPPEEHVKLFDVCP